MSSYLVFTASDGHNYIKDLPIRVYMPGLPMMEQKTDANGKTVFVLPVKHESFVRYFAEWNGHSATAQIQTMERVVDGSVSLNFSGPPPRPRGSCCL